MNRMPITRMLVAFTIIGLSVLALLHGWDIVRFSIAEARLSSDDNRWNALRSWMDISGLAYSARVSALSTVNDWNDKSAVLARRDEEIEILAARPLSADFWLLLADMRQIAGEDPSIVVETLAISALVGPNEGYIVTQRGVFAVSIWEMLSPEAKQRSAKDLAAVELSDIQKARLRAVLSDKPGSVREDIGNNLKAAGLSEKRLAEFGLTFNHAPPGN